MNPTKNPVTMLPPGLLCTGCGKPIHACFTWDKQDKVWHTECFDASRVGRPEPKSITVAELIEILKPFSGDTPVHVYYDSKCGMEGVTGIAEVKNDGIYLDTTGN